MVRVGGMSRPPTRQSRRLNGQSPSPPPPLPPERSSRADSNALHSVNSVEPEHQHSDLYEVQNDMDVIQELPNAESSIPELNFDDWGGSPPGGALAVSLRPEDQATIDQFMSEPDLSFLENALSTSSSPLYPLAPISADPSPRENSYFNGTNFFVLYVFPHRSAALIISPPAPSPALTPAANSRPVSRSTSRTPLSQSALTVQRGLFNVALFTAALDSHFRQEGHQLAMLMNSKNSDLHFGVGYTQIRQLLIIEDVITRASRMRIAIPNDLKITDSVPLWAGLNLSTYMNNRTYAKNARGTLIHLRNRKNANIVSALSAPDQQKENDLRRFLESRWRNP
ncbi:hypothetical protein R3P38DRAFT_3219017 [Favolaschia claudopus]|uniref:Uncharacterized protein n=1 Tax=Favolaschia claudopus TaxID=2862362 RepID=A0AAW0A220_9AGAR